MSCYMLRNWYVIVETINNFFPTNYRILFMFQIVKDPKQALQKARELWAYLSADEPENQARPQTLEQLLVLLTRESARRVVHLLNYTTAVAASIPR